MTDARRARELHATALATARRGALAQAIPVWGEALRHNPDDVEVLVHLGHALAACGERAQASELATRAARLAPETAAPWLLLGHLRVDARDLTAALESYALARRYALPGEAADVTVARAKALRLAGQPDAARQELASAPRTRVDVLLLDAQLAADRGAHDNARDLLMEAGELEPDHPEPYKALAALLATSDRSLARELVEHALVLAPDDAEAKALLSTLTGA